MKALAATVLLTLAVAGCVSKSPPKPPLPSASDPKVLERREKAIAVKVAEWSAGRQPRGIRRLGDIRSATITGPLIRSGGDEEVYCVALNEYVTTPDAIFPSEIDGNYGLHIRVFRRSNLIGLSRVNFCTDLANTRPLPQLVYYRRLQQARIDVHREYQEAAKAAKAAAATGAK